MVFTSVLKHYKKRFPEKKIYLLIKQGTGLENIFSRKFADEVTTVDYRRFAVDPFYGAMFIGRLRSVGFEEVIDHDFSASEIMGKIISVSVGAREVIGYEGIDPEFVHPFDVQQRKNLELVFNKIYPRYTKIIPSVDGGTVLKEKLPSAVSHYVAIYEGATGFKESDYATELPMGYSHQASEGEEVLRKFGLKSGEYAVMNLNASVAYKRWPLGNFKKVADRLSSAGLDVVLIGSRGEELLADEFRKTFPLCLNLAGKTDLRELLSLIGGSFVVVSNDTSIVHIAVALRKPSLCVTGGGQFGMFALYGYGDINKWVYKTTPCFCDNWQCGLRAKVGEPSPCLAAVSVGSVLDELDELLRYLKKNKNYPREKFSVGADVERGAKISGGRRGIKVLYAGTEFENYDPLRRGSFEYANFYSTLKNMKGVEVVDYPFDRILGMGKKRFNDKLLRLVERERPDLFFAFMYTDELEPRVLMEIKKRTKSVAWFADDYWRFFNYSRHWPPYFTKIVTTYSRAVDWYKKAGYDNVVLSQWACNTAFYKPVAASKDIDVSFVGQMKSGRMRVVEALHRAGIDVQCFGFGWPGGRVSHDEAPRIIGRSKICLNLTDRKELWVSFSYRAAFS